MSVLYFILAMGPMAALGIYNPHEVDAKGRCLAEPGTLQALYCPVGSKPAPRDIKTGG